MGQSNSTSLHQAIQHNNTKQLKHLLHKKNNSFDINEKVAEKTALFLVVMHEDDQATELLLQHGADPNIICQVEKNSWAFEWSVIHEACWRGNTLLLQQLIQNGGDINLEAHHKMTPLHIAGWFGHREVVKLLINLGCDVNRLDRFNESAIVMPVCQGDYEIVRLLLMAGCKLNSRCWANIRKIQGKYDFEFRDKIYTRHGPFSLFSLAIKYAWLRIALLFLQHGFNPNKYSIMDILEDIKSNIGGIDEDGHRLLECFLAAGYKFRTRDERELQYLALLINENVSDSVEENGEKSNMNDLLSSQYNNESVLFQANSDAYGSTSQLSHIPIITFNPNPRIQNLSTAVDKQFTDWLLSQNGLRQPHTLKQYCRVAIRSHIRVCVQQASVVPPIQNLALPNQLKEYLMLCEFGNPAEECKSNGMFTQGYLDTEKLYFSMPRHVKHQNVHVYVQFWMASCCCTKY